MRFRGLPVAALVGAALICGAGLAAAETPTDQLCTAQLAATPAAPVAWSRPVEADASPNWAYAAFRGVGCERCNPRINYCVINFVRYEYVCAPLGTTACTSTDWTGWCPANQTCWFGRCR